VFKRNFDINVGDIQIHQANIAGFISNVNFASVVKIFISLHGNVMEDNTAIVTSAARSGNMRKNRRTSTWRQGKLFFKIPKLCSMRTLTRHSAVLISSPFRHQVG
jgi:hypothetical protein